MRITGGTLGGRIINVPKKGVRPTQERVREAVFSSLAGGIEGARVLDLFAGSGALGLEAWSRGAGHVCWVEQDARTFQMLKANVRTLCGAEAADHCMRADVMVYLRRCRNTYDFILADPPYEGHTLNFDTYQFLESIATQGCLKLEGCLILEQRASQAVSEHPSWVIAKSKSYGDTRVLYYALNPEP